MNKLLETGRQIKTKAAQAGRSGIARARDFCVWLRNRGLPAVRQAAGWTRAKGIRFRAWAGPVCRRGAIAAWVFTRRMARAARVRLLQLVRLVRRTAMQAWAWWQARQRARAQRLLPDLPPEAVLPLRATQTRVDVGGWFGRARVWMAWDGKTLSLAAVGRRPLVMHLDRADVHASVYNHVTGELVLRPAADARVHCLKIDPLTARRLLDTLAPPSDPNPSK